MEILIFHSSSYSQFCNLVSELKKKYSQCRITGVCKEGNLNEIKENVDRVIFYPYRLYTFTGIILNSLKELRQSHYDLAFIPINNVEGIGYRRIKLITLALIPTKNIIEYFSSECQRQVDWNFLLPSGFSINLKKTLLLPALFILGLFSFIWCYWPFALRWLKRKLVLWN